MSKVFLAIGLLISCTAFGQRNLVKNGDFEVVGKKIKEPGQIEMAESWSSPTDQPADLFSVKAVDAYGVPENIYGKQAPHDDLGGNSYVGILTYSYRDREKTSFIQGGLNNTLEQGVVYCVKFYLSMSDLSKYATNNIGLYLSEKKVMNKDIEGGGIKPQIIHPQNMIYNDQYEWKEVCMPYKAKGGERYLTIGNFSSGEQTKTERLRRPSGFTSAQLNNGYYFIDNVGIYNMEELSSGDCDCFVSDGPSMEVVYTQNVSTDNTLDADKSVEVLKVYFDDKKAKVKEDQYNTIASIINVMKKNTEMKIEVIGHTADLEQVAISYDLSQDRATAVKGYLVGQGISADRVMTKGMKAENPETDDQSLKGQAQNRRVTFKVL